MNVGEVFPVEATWYLNGVAVVGPATVEFSTFDPAKLYWNGAAWQAGVHTFVMTAPPDFQYAVTVPEAWSGRLVTATARIPGMPPQSVDVEISESDNGGGSVEYGGHTG